MNTQPFLFQGAIFNTLEFASVEATNKFLGQNKDFGVLTETPTGIYVAAISDIGRLTA